jgi:hypothetical protein
MLMASARYHVKIKKSRTTVSVPIVVEELLALKLDVEPHTLPARAAVRAWLQAEIDSDPGAIPPAQGSEPTPYSTSHSKYRVVGFD